VQFFFEVEKCEMFFIFKINCVYHRKRKKKKKMSYLQHGGDIYINNKHIRAREARERERERKQ